MTVPIPESAASSASDSTSTLPSNVSRVHAGGSPQPGPETLVPVELPEVSSLVDARPFVVAPALVDTGLPEDDAIVAPESSEPSPPDPDALEVPPTGVGDRAPPHATSVTTPSKPRLVPLIDPYSTIDRGAVSMKGAVEEHHRLMLRTVPLPPFRPLYLSVRGR